ncbi:Threonine--tRNA ligase [Frankliniella fusca]|uniref:Threonine--tRNA ligase n=1 Tax=Frankliniella fusca TaxID=407009 RepID=A0AAE1HU84_9NEOP|nr:Threonine--tRNA ligase [Frankliniella fusca]
MDLAYLSDAFSHMSMRGTSASYGRYDQPWGRGWAPEDQDRGLTVAEKHRQANKQKKIEQKKQNQPCPICLENKRRKLGSYIRQKSQESSEILVEEEEEHVSHDEPSPQGDCKDKSSKT